MKNQENVKQNLENPTSEKLLATNSTQLLEDAEIKQNSNSNSELFKVHQVPDSPFSIIEDTEKGLFVGVLGNHRITEDEHTTFESCLESLTHICWNRISQLIWAIVQKFINNNLTDENNG